MKLKSKFAINSAISNQVAYIKFVHNLPENFDRSNDLIFKGRNSVKKFNIAIDNLNYQDVIVKKFKKPDIFKSIVYGFFRRSKAYRAFYNSLELTKRSIETPAPIAYLEEYKFGFLKSAYYVSFPDFKKPIEIELEKSEGFNKEIAKAFACFVGELHEKGILHKDLNNTNVLWENLGHNKFHFSLIDTNRMSFFDDNEIPIDSCLKNLCNFTGNLDLHKFVLENYIKYRNLSNPSLILEKAISIKRMHDISNYRLKKRKRILKGIFMINR